MLLYYGNYTLLSLFIFLAESVVVVQVRVNLKGESAGNPSTKQGSMVLTMSVVMEKMSTKSQKVKGRIYQYQTPICHNTSILPGVIRNSYVLRSA